jgi:hypothetical protein
VCFGHFCVCMRMCVYVCVFACCVWCTLRRHPFEDHSGGVSEGGGGSNQGGRRGPGGGNILIDSLMHTYTGAMKCDLGGWCGGVVGSKRHKAQYHTRFHTPLYSPCSSASTASDSVWWSWVPGPWSMSQPAAALALAARTTTATHAARVGVHRSCPCSMPQRQHRSMCTGQSSKSDTPSKGER